MHICNYTSKLCHRILWPGARQNQADYRKSREMRFSDGAKGFSFQSLYKNICLSLKGAKQHKLTLKQWTMNSYLSEL